MNAFRPKRSTQSRGSMVVVAASCTITGRRVSMARALTGISRSGSASMAVKARHISGMARPSANWDMSGTARSPCHSSIEHRSTAHTCAILMATRFSSCVESSVEPRISATSSSARVSARRSVVSEYMRAFSRATAACAASEPISDSVSGVSVQAVARCTAKAPRTRSPMAMG